MFHLGAYFVSVGQTADTDMTAVTDDILTIQNGHFILSRPMGLLAAIAMSATLTRCKLASPSMRQIASPYIRPLNVALLPANNPNMWLLDHNEFMLQPFEEIQAQITSGLAMGNENARVGIWLRWANVPIPQGNIIPLRFTSTTAAVANAWTTLSLTFTDTIPAGVYAAVLSEHFSTTGTFHRWIFSNQEPRPGYVSFAAGSSRLPYAITKGQFGQMGRFRSNDLPRLQVLCNSTDSTHEGYLHVVRVGNLS